MMSALNAVRILADMVAGALRSIPTDKDGEADQKETGEDEPAVKMMRGAKKPAIKPPEPAKKEEVDE